MSVRSVYDEATEEAARHRWIESQKQGRDLGESAVREWYDRHWVEYCWYRHLEHLEGRTQWREFDDDGFGLIGELLGGDNLLADRILDRVYAGQENLEIIQWAFQFGLETGPVLNILTQLHINRRRLEPRHH